MSTIEEILRQHNITSSDELIGFMKGLDGGRKEEFTKAVHHEHAKQELGRLWLKFFFGKVPYNNNLLEKFNEDLSDLDAHNFLEKVMLNYMELNQETDNQTHTDLIDINDEYTSIAQMYVDAKLVQRFQNALSTLDAEETAFLISYGASAQQAVDNQDYDATYTAYLSAVSHAIEKGKVLIINKAENLLTPKHL